MAGTRQLLPALSLQNSFLTTSNAVTADSSCDCWIFHGVGAGVEVSLPNIAAGLKFSWPIYKSGFHVLIASAVEEGGIWAFAQVCVHVCGGGVLTA